jgi:hypothetical protein
VNQNLAHDLRGDCVEVGPVLVVHLLCIDRLQAGLVDQRRGLKNVAGTLAHHVLVCAAMQFVVHQWNELVQRCLFTAVARREAVE